MKEHTTAADLPTTEQIARERSRLRYKRRYGRTLRSTAAILLVVAALNFLGDALRDAFDVRRTE